MPCYYPKHGYRESDSGPLTFTGPSGGAGMRLVEIPCGECVGCRVCRTEGWAARCMHEASLYEFNSFLTLTYDPAHIPDDSGVNVRHLQLFFKRLRKDNDGFQVAVNGRRPIRYFACGEYGENTLRPHYHVLLFNFAFVDQRPFGRDNFVSPLLEDTWRLGHCVVAPLTPASAAYVTKYSLKKVVGSGAARVRGGRAPEFAVMSRNPGIGAWWLEKYYTDVFPRDHLVVGGRARPVPRYYFQKHAELDPIGAEAIKHQRYERALLRPMSERSERRREDSAAVHLARLNHFAQEAVI